jgi:hypothetical protein
MRKRVLFLCALTLLACLPAPGCGSGGSDDLGGLFLGPAFMALAFLALGPGEIQTLCLSNYSRDDATVYVTAMTDLGGMYPPGMTAVTVPGLGAVDVPVSTFTGASPTGGWLLVDTRDVTMLDPVTGFPTPTATTGRIVAALGRDFLGQDGDTTPSSIMDGEVRHLPFLPWSNSIQLINYSASEMVGGSIPQPITLDVDWLDAFGVSYDSDTFILPPNGSMTVAIPASPSGAGQAEVTPVGPFPAGFHPQIAAATWETVQQVHVETRFIDVRNDDLRELGVDFDFGVDAAGNYKDFGLLANNTTDEDQSFVIRSVRDASGAELLSGAPWTVLLEPFATKWLASRTLDSLGLDVGEASPFDSDFGDVTQQVMLDVAYAEVSVPKGVELGFRLFDSVFDSFYRIAPGSGARENHEFLAKLAVATSLISAERNFVSVMNPTGTMLTITPRVYTPEGTEYIMPSVLLNARARLDLSLDGNVFRNDPTDLNEAPVPFVTMRIPVLGRMFANSRRERRDNQGLIIFITPTLSGLIAE